MYFHKCRGLPSPVTVVTATATNFSFERRPGLMDYLFRRSGENKTMI